MATSGSATRSVEECEMSRSCHSGMPSMTGTSWARAILASPQIRSERTGLRLCGIAEEPFCPCAERLGQLGDLGPLPVPHLERDRLADRGQERKRVHPFGDAVAEHDLGGHVRGPQAQLGHDRLLDGRVDVGVAADRS